MVRHLRLEQVETDAPGERATLHHPLHRREHASRPYTVHESEGKALPASVVAGENTLNDERVNPFGVCDMFRIGIGPSSSHTVGPMRAGLHFSTHLATRHSTSHITHIRVDLFGSLAATGRGHNTDRAVLLGLSGFNPETVPISTVDSIEADIDRRGTLIIPGFSAIPFERARDIVFSPRVIFPYHVNAMTITAYGEPGEDENAVAVVDNGGERVGQIPRALVGEGVAIATHTYYSVGGGFVMEECGDPAEPCVAPLATDEQEAAAKVAVPYAYRSATELLALCKETGMSIAQLAMANETALRSREAVIAHMDRVYAVMGEAIKQGTTTHGVLPGGLNVERRAPGLAAKLEGARLRGRAGAGFDGAGVGGVGAGNAGDTWAGAGHVNVGASGSGFGESADFGANPAFARDPLEQMGWVNLFALAVNEENAAGHRIVTAPTNGAAGIIPAVLSYYEHFVAGANREGMYDFLLAGAAIGGLIKTNASIAGAEVGCQGEVGSASAMAAAGFAQALGGTPLQVENSAEIAMEHSLGLTCDPVGGLVQIPCIERNAIAAVKAINAAYMALWGDGTHSVSFDTVIETMRQTGQDMLSKYKETSEGGLAVNVVEC